MAVGLYREQIVMTKWGLSWWGQLSLLETGDMLNGLNWIRLLG